MQTMRLFSFLFLGATLFGQVAVSVGPSPAPVGCPIAISVANDTNTPLTLSTPCPYRVRDALGTIIYTPFCIQIIVNVNPGAVFTTYWPQITDFGAQVAPGNYLVEVFLPGGASFNSLTISNTVVAGAAPLGVNRIGTTRPLYLCAPQDGGYPYLMGASLPPTSGGIPTCGGVVPLEADWLLALSLAPNPFFTNFTGNLSNTGSTTAPTITVPNDPSIIGANFVVAFVTVDQTAPCVVRSISAPLLILIV